MPSTPAAPLLRLTCASAFLRLSRSTIASIDGQLAARLSTSVVAARASVPSAPALRASPLAPARKVISSSVFCRMARARSPFYLPFHRSGLRRVAPPTMPSADFSAAIASLAARSVRVPEQSETSRGKIDRLRRAPAGFTTEAEREHSAVCGLHPKQPIARLSIPTARDGLGP